MAQIGVIKVQTPNGIVQVPVYSEGSSGSNVQEMVKINTPSGTGFVPAVATSQSPAYPYLKVNTENHGILAFHDSPTISGGLEITTSLNGDTAKITFYEDTTGNGEPDNQETFMLTGGTESFDSSNFDLSQGNEAWWSINLENDSNIETAGQVDEVKIG
mgnify:FL=1